MKAVTMWEPWASLFAEGHRKIDTRSWYTHFRGPLVIHAALRTPELHTLSWVTGEFMRKAMELLGETSTHPGMALCTVRLVNIVPVEEIREGLSEQELLLGNYSSGRHAWIFEDLRKFKKPFRVKGNHVLWELDDAIIKKHGEKVVI